MENPAKDVAESIIQRAWLARIAILELQRRAGVGNTTIHRWKNSKTGVYCQATADKLEKALNEAEKENAEMERMLAG